jgi:hypothetical protein
MIFRTPSALLDYIEQNNTIFIYFLRLKPIFSNLIVTISRRIYKKALDIDIIEVIVRIDYRLYSGGPEGVILGSLEAIIKGSGGV